MLRHSFRISTILLALVFASATAFADGYDRAGTAAAPELLIPVGARDMALGGASIATSSGLEVPALEPGRLVQVRIQRGHHVFDDVLSGGYSHQLYSHRCQFQEVRRAGPQHQGAGFWPNPGDDRGQSRWHRRGPFRRPSSLWA